MPSIFAIMFSTARATAAKRKGIKTPSHDPQEKWSKHTKPLTPLTVGDRVRIQNQTGPNPKKWDHNGIVIEVWQFHQYLVRIDGSGRQTLRNRKFLRKYISVYQLTKRRSILEDIAHLPPASPCEDMYSQISIPPPSTPTPEEINQNKKAPLMAILKKLSL